MYSPLKKPGSTTPCARSIRAPLVAVLAFGLGACATATNPPKPSDPWENWNRRVQSFNDTLDDYALKPIARGYRWITPSWVDLGVSNFFSNLDDVGVFVNDFLQFKFAQGGRDAGRFVINSVAGVGGFIDVASEVDLTKHKEDFDQTLAVWGVPSGPYVVLPLFGPSTPRHVLGLVGDSATNPVNFIAPMAIPLGSGALNAVDKRADFLSASKVAEEAATDPYEFIRNAYFQERNYQIHDGNPPEDEEFERELEAELDETPAADPQ
jgi:phospholipid-binding lipoprotein MlaA